MPSQSQASRYVPQQEKPQQEPIAQVLTTKPAEVETTKSTNPWGQFKDRETFVDLHLF